MLTLTFSDTELCSLLSNALENAMCACKIIADRDKGLISLRMSLRLYSKNNKLCIKLRNRYEVKPVFHEGLFPYPKNRGMASVQKAWLILWKSTAVVFVIPYTATLNVSKDGGAWSGHGKTFALKLNTDETVEHIMTGTGDTVTAQVPNGTWKVYEGAADTGKTITISGAAGTAVLDYYTVQYAVSNAGTASGSSISAATYDGTSITSGDIVPGGKTLSLTATGAGASSYTYAWSGAGTNGETTPTLTVDNLSGVVNARGGGCDAAHKGDPYRNRPDQPGLEALARLRVQGYTGAGD